MGGPINQSVSPGIEGFIVTFLIACALWLLMRNMSTRLRNMKYREEAEDEQRQAREAGSVDTRPSAVGGKVPGEGADAADDSPLTDPPARSTRVDPHDDGGRVAG